MSRYITFEPLPQATPKTLRWKVVAKEGGGVIGTVSWYGPWRKYCFFPAPSTVFEQVCLRDIAAFCEMASVEHRKARAARAAGGVMPA